MRAGFNVLERALSQEMTGIDTVEIETTETVGTDDLGSTRIAFGKYLSDSVYLRYAQGFTAGERDILLEYQMSLRTLISAEIKSRINQTGTEDEFNIDFKWRFRY
jgi:autotransporter translocation and assembly factor TamB